MTQTAFSALDAKVSKSELLMSVAPLRLMCAGGCVAVMYMNVRGSTEDVDILVDPNVDTAPEYQTAFAQAIRAVSESQKLQTDWMNDELKGMEWSLECKLRRIESARRQLDIDDATALVHHNMQSTGQPLGVQYLQALNFNGFETPISRAIATVKRQYERQYGQVGIADIEWDEQARTYRYNALDGTVCYV
ncbi:Uu.00g033100.m01.CDS01 [Anthostomella pinea]|uniref:Uu.00g033100.m01.CDS01 n=1 Tax=Anthostomella pinea TaxID=933095 RepID=A0AAI8V9E6_9PEZI|nr:Uu.00g033100.m01.CDS01 [Anthostomella pinea]